MEEEVDVEKAFEYAVLVDFTDADEKVGQDAADDCG